MNKTPLYMLAGCAIVLLVYFLIGCISVEMPIPTGDEERIAMSTRIPIILGAHPGDFTWQQERRYLDLGVVLYGAGNDEPGLCPDWGQHRDVKVINYGNLPLIIPIKQGNEYKWDAIYEQYCELNNRAILFETGHLDEPRYKSWQGAQEFIDIAATDWPLLDPLVAGPWPVPPGELPIHGALIWCIDMHIIAMVEAVYPDWRGYMGIPEGTEVWGYLSRYDEGDDPFKPGWSGKIVVPTFYNHPENLGNFLRNHGLTGFLYYNAIDPFICQDGKPTEAMVMVWYGCG